MSYAVNIGRVVLVSDQPITPEQHKEAVEVLWRDAGILSPATVERAVGGVIIEIHVDVVLGKR